MKIDKIKIVFFSGTGNSARVSDIFQSTLKAKEKIVIKQELRLDTPLSNDDNEDMLILIYPVHAFNAPEPVYEYVNSITTVEKIPVAVISVSGGGEITPNTASRLHCINRLENKGFNVVYETMLVMPSNCFVPTKDGLSLRLLEVLPYKVDIIVNELLSGHIRRTKPNLLNRFFSHLGELEKFGTRYFGRKIKVTEVCTGCGWCEKACPRKNITLVNGRPRFNNACTICLKCFYGCPEKALTPGIGKFILIKQGFSINSFENKLPGNEYSSVKTMAKGYLWKGIRKYLLEDIKDTP